MYCLINSFKEAEKEYFMGTSKQDNRFTIFNMWFTFIRKSSSDHDEKFIFLTLVRPCEIWGLNSGVANN